MTSTEQVLAKRRFATTAEGFKELLRYGKQWPDRLWAVEGCNRIGQHVASRLVMAGETVVDVPPKLSARLRMFDTRQGRKTDPDARIPAVGTQGWRQTDLVRHPTVWMTG